MDINDITAATPMIMPSTVREERILLVVSAVKAVRNVLAKLIVPASS
jgi:hypothetical protein